MAEAIESSAAVPRDLLRQPPRSLWRDAWRTLSGNHFAIAGGVVLLLLIFAAVAAPLVAPYDPNAQNYDHLLEGTSLQHPFGTDNFGRDILSRVIYGGRISLSIGFLGTLLGVAVGLTVGLVSGYYGRWVDSVLMRLLDILLAFPGLLLAIAIVAALGPGNMNVVVAIGVFSVPVFARILRGSILSLNQADFIIAARAVGASNRRIMVIHLLPNAIGSILVIATLRLGTAILTVAVSVFSALASRRPRLNGDRC